jgi:hypothetical protein
MKVSELLGVALYAYVFGVTGCGKTLLPMTLKKREDGTDVYYITAEQNGPTSLATTGYLDVNVDVISANTKKDPFPQVLKLLNAAGANEAYKTVVLDGCTVLSGRAIEHYMRASGKGGAGELGSAGRDNMGFDGWDYVLNGFRTIERYCEKLVRSGRNVVLTSWELEPEYDEDTDTCVKYGRPMLQGQAAKWLPGGADIIARMTSRFKKENGKSIFKGQLHLKPEDDFISKTRWSFLESPYPADLGRMAREVVKFAKANRKPVNLKATINKAAPTKEK